MLKESLGETVHSWCKGVWNPGFLQALHSLQAVFFIFIVEDGFLSSSHHVLMADSWMEAMGEEGYALSFSGRLAISIP